MSNLSEHKPAFGALTTWRLVLALLLAAGVSFGLAGCSGSKASSSKDAQAAEQVVEADTQDQAASVTFRNDALRVQHYNKHGKSMGFKSASAYERAGAQVVANPSSLHKTQKDDGDDVYYLQSTNDFVVVSTDGYIRTYFRPDSGLKYYNRQ